MNNLVAYGDDSDEESPRRRSHEGPSQSISSTSPKQRRDSDVYFEDYANSPSRRSNSSSSDRSDTFAEPPPPKRRIYDSHSPSPSIRTPLGMAKVTSVSSLVSYAGGDQDEEDNFDMAEQDTHVTARESLSAAEPPPPPRASQDDQSDGEDERMISEALAESQAVVRDVNAEGSSTGSATPARNDSPQTPAQGDAIEDLKEIQIPPSPPGEVDAVVQRRFERYFEEKARGNNFNTVLQNRRDFLNPSCYETFIERYELQEKGSNFKPEIFDPFTFPDNCFYDAIAEEQRKIMEKTASDAKSKKPSTSTTR